MIFYDLNRVPVFCAKQVHLPMCIEIGSGCSIFDINSIIILMLLIIGLDGADWRILNPWIESGALPYLTALRAQGRWRDHRYA